MPARRCYSFTLRPWPCDDTQGFAASPGSLAPLALCRSEPLQTVSPPVPAILSCTPCPPRYTCSPILFVYCRPCPSPISSKPARECRWRRCRLSQTTCAASCIPGASEQVLRTHREQRGLAVLPLQLLLPALPLQRRPWRQRLPPPAHALCPPAPACSAMRTSLFCCLPNPCIC